MRIANFIKSYLKFRLHYFLTGICLVALCVFIYQLRQEYLGGYGLVPLPLGSQSEPHNNFVIPEKYNDHDVKERIIKDKIKYLTQHKNEDKNKESNLTVDTATPHVHIFYNTHVDWNKKAKVFNSRISNAPVSRFLPVINRYQINISVVNDHFQKIRKCGIGVVIVTRTPNLTETLFEQLLRVAPMHDVAIATEFVLRKNQTVQHIHEHIHWLEKFRNYEGLYKVFSISRNQSVPLLYVKSAYQLDVHDKYLCTKKKLLRDKINAIIIGHIKSEEHAKLMRRICFDGYYPRIPSNGATFSSTWKNWSFLKVFAKTYKMLFIPTVGPGYEHGIVKPGVKGIRRDRSNGRYYAVAWRTAILSHIGFIGISSFNNWEDGTQIDDGLPMNYVPKNHPRGEASKYLELTTFWVYSFLKSSKQPLDNCNEFVNNTIC